MNSASQDWDGWVDWSRPAAASSLHDWTWQEPVVATAQAAWPSEDPDDDDANGWQSVRCKKRGNKKKTSAGEPATVVSLAPAAVAKDAGARKGSSKGKGTQIARQAATPKPLRPIDWAPRAEDWGSSVKLFCTAREALDSADQALLAYLMSFTFVQSAPLERHMTLVILKGHFDDQRLDFQEFDWHEARVPGIWNNQLRIVNAWIGLSSSTAPELVRPAVAFQAPPSLTATCVLRVHADCVGGCYRISWCYLSSLGD